MAMAGIKQAKDILSGDLPYDPRVLQINDTAFNFAANLSEPSLSFFFSGEKRRRRKKNILFVVGRN